MLNRLADDFEQPNGLCLSLDEKRLFVNDSPRGISASSMCWLMAHCVGVRCGLSCAGRGQVCPTA